MKVKLNKSNTSAGEAFDMVKYVIVGCLLAMAPLLVGWLVYCTVDTVAEDHNAFLFSIFSGGSLGIIMLFCFGKYMDEHKNSGVIFENIMWHMVKRTAAISTAILAVILFGTFMTSLIGGFGIAMTVLLLIGGGIGMHAYYKSNEYKEKEKQ